MIRLFYDVTNRDSDIIYDEESKVRFSKSKPYCEVSYISNTIKRAIEFGRIIDIDNVAGVKLNDKTRLMHDRILKYANIKRNISTTDNLKEKENESKNNKKKKVSKISKSEE